MQCERLFNLTKTWFLSVQDEAMAPARMLTFIKDHAENCEICRADPDLKEEIIKITEIILPESRQPKPAEQSQDDDEEFDDEISEDDDELGNDLDEELDEEI